MATAPSHGVTKQLVSARIALGMISKPEARVLDKEIEQSLLDYDQLVVSQAEAAADYKSRSMAARRSKSAVRRTVNGVEALVAVRLPALYPKLPNPAAYKDVDISVYAASYAVSLIKEGGKEGKWLGETLQRVLDKASSDASSLGDAVKSREEGHAAMKSKLSALRGVLGHVLSYLHRVAPKGTPAHKHISPPRKKEPEQVPNAA